MSLYTSSYLKNLVSENRSVLNERMINESKRVYTTFDVFLSYTLADKDVVGGIYIELIKQGLTVYLDWVVDPDLQRSKVTKESAERIRRRLKSSKSLLLAMSENVVLSKWVPWELGYVDGHTGRCGLFPVSDDRIPPTTFTRSEFLLLYPYVKKATVTDLSYSEKSYITESAYSYADFKNWVNGDAVPIYHNKNIDVL